MDWVAEYKAMHATLPDVNQACNDYYKAKTNRYVDPNWLEQRYQDYQAALAESRRIQGEFGERARAAGICVGCLDKNGPSHNASSRCESGGRSHCTCDVCW